MKNPDKMSEQELRAEVQRRRFECDLLRERLRRTCLRDSENGPETLSIFANAQQMDSNSPLFKAYQLLKDSGDIK